nr:MepB family protein [uncultured Pedobacter sp.]
MDLENKEYSACSFRLDDKKVLFRKAKITPKKVGQFISIWKRNDLGITQPFDETDPIDFIIIVCEFANRSGAFVFPKWVLQENRIFTTNGIEGKRGIRVYPTWDSATNTQAKKTQNWQVNYFVEFDGDSKHQLIMKLLEA